MIELFPTSARVDDGVLSLGGLTATELAERFGTPLVVYCEETLRTQAALFLRAAPGALVVYGTKAFPNVAVMRLLAEEGLGADVSTLGELAFAQRAGIDGDRLLVHGNNKSDEELRAAAGSGALVVLDALDEPERAAAAGVRRVLVRVTPGVVAETHEAIRTGHIGSKFGLDPDDALEAVRRAREAGLDVEGLHVHVGSQLFDAQAHLLAIKLLADFSVRCRDELGWTPAIVDVGGGFGVRHVATQPEPHVGQLVRSLMAAVARGWAERKLAPPRVVVEPGRALVSPAGVTLYRVGAVKRAGDKRYVAIDGGMSDNCRRTSHISFCVHWAVLCPSRGRYAWDQPQVGPIFSRLGARTNGEAPGADRGATRRTPRRMAPRRKILARSGGKSQCGLRRAMRLFAGCCHRPSQSRPTRKRKVVWPIHYSPRSH